MTDIAALRSQLTLAEEAALSDCGGMMSTAPGWQLDEGDDVVQIGPASDSIAATVTIAVTKGSGSELP